ncbi:MAG TPA: amidohydrolase family protein [Acidimicrobiales bacterium]|nr:amidohydrolase family protein [Acidimicrobiales bacterium]
MATGRTGWLTNAQVVDVTDGTLRRDRNIEFVDGTVRAVSSTLPPSAANVIDARGRFVLPGLTSCHTHLSIVFPLSATDEGESPAVTVLRAAKRARDALDAGITTVRCVHEQNRADLWLRDAQRRGWAEAPRILGAGRALTTPGGHGAGMACVTAEGEEEFYRAAAEELKAGADHIKIFINGGLARAGEDLSHAEMSDAELAGAVRAAREHRTYVVAHSGASEAIRQALGRGVRCFEHAYELDSPTASLLAQADAFLTPTLVVTRCEPWMRANGFSDASIARATAAAGEHLQSIQNAVAAGVPLLCGTDLPPGDDVGGLPATVLEMKLLEEAGLSRLGALQAATTNPARLLGSPLRTGQVQPGFFADLIAVDDNPLDDLSALGAVRLVLQEGRLVKAAW